MAAAEETPAALMRRAAALLRERVAALPDTEWGDRPWEVTECSDNGRGDCLCIVMQGEYKPFGQPQVPLIQYVCDAETPEHAAFVASMHPAFALAVAKLLEKIAWMGEMDAELLGRVGCDEAVVIARAYLGKAA